MDSRHSFVLHIWRFLEKTANLMYYFYWRRARWQGGYQGMVPFWIQYVPLSPEFVNIWGRGTEPGDICPWFWALYQTPCCRGWKKWKWNYLLPPLHCFLFLLADLSARSLSRGTFNAMESPLLIIDLEYPLCSNLKAIWAASTLKSDALLQLSWGNIQCK